ncbi:MAG: glycosyltransferase family 4 protein [Cyclobacteriaceae bacterium]|nr:glycosyltransferase family 4 protein [Cyclobacteriaceae bacterium]
MDTQVADKLIGVERTRQVLEGALYRFAFTSNPFKYFAPLLKIASHPLEAIRIYNSCLANGLSKKKAIGQLLYGYQIIGKTFDLVYINALQTGRHFAISSIFPNSTIIASSRGQDFDWNPERYDSLLSKLDYLHALGTHLQNRAMERKFPIERITIIPPAALPTSNSINSKIVHEANTIQIVTAARLIWTKGYVYSLRAISLLKEMLPLLKIRYNILGDGADLELLKFEINRLGLEEEVVLRGWVTQTEVNECISSSDIYLLLSIEEGFNNSVMQAQSLGLPCVVSDAGGLPDNVLNEVTGFVVPRYNARMAADRLYQLTVAKEKREEMGQNARRRMTQDFNLTIQIKKYSTLFKKALKVIE